MLALHVQHDFWPPSTFDSVLKCNLPCLWVPAPRILGRTSIGGVSLHQVSNAVERFPGIGLREHGMYQCNDKLALEPLRKSASRGVESDLGSIGIVVNV